MRANYLEKRWDEEGFSIPRTGQIVKNCPKYLNVCVHAKLDTYHKYNLYILLRLMKWKITIQSQRDHGHRSYCTFFQLPWLLSIWASAPSSVVYMSKNALLSMQSHKARPTQIWPVLSSSSFNNHLGFPCILLRDKKFRPRIGKLQWRPKWMKRYFKTSPPTSFCRLLRLLLFYKFVDFILSESPEASI